jgi:predicted RecA/RadA family phage recombinase
MAGMNEDGQWIVLMGLLIAVAMFFLALIINQSALVGQTTAEGVLEFPKNDIKDLRSEIFDYMDRYVSMGGGRTDVAKDIVAISMQRKNTVVQFQNGTPQEVSGRFLNPITIHYNNGVTVYDETVYY